MPNFQKDISEKMTKTCLNHARQCAIMGFDSLTNIMFSYTKLPDRHAFVFKSLSKKTISYELDDPNSFFFLLLMCMRMIKFNRGKFQ